MKDIHLDKIHPKSVSGVEPTEKTGKDIIALRYDMILPVIDGMIAEAQRQEFGDRSRGRTKLAGELSVLVEKLVDVKTSVEKLVAICKPWIDKEKTL